MRSSLDMASRHHDSSGRGASHRGPRMHPLGRQPIDVVRGRYQRQWPSGRTPAGATLVRAASGATRHLAGDQRRCRVNLAAVKGAVRAPSAASTSGSHQRPTAGAEDQDLRRSDESGHRGGPSSVRDDFRLRVKEVIAARAAHRCSNPQCGAATSGPGSDDGASVNVGVAATSPRRRRAASVSTPPCHQRSARPPRTVCGHARHARS